MNTHTKKPTTSFSFPDPLLAWINEESSKLDMSRNAFVIMKLQQSKDFEVVRQIQALGVRVTQLEHKMR